MKTYNLALNKTSGLSLVELMIAMAVSGILMLGISQIFSINSRSYKVQDESARMQESGRYAFNTLMTDIRRAGYFGGNATVGSVSGSEGIAPPARNCLTTDTSWGRMIERAFYGLNDALSHNDKDGLAVNYTACIPAADYLRGDILVMRYAKGAAITSFDSNRLYIRNSLFEGRLFKGIDQAVTASNAVSENPQSVHELAAHAYYVGPSGRNCRFKASDNSDIPIPALFREKLSSAGVPEKEEVSSGIEYIQFQYGIDNSGDGHVHSYYNAHQLSNDEGITPNWTQIQTVRLWVLVRADCPTAGYTNSKTYTMGDIDVPTSSGGYKPNDSFKRQLYSTVVAVRN